MSSRCWSLVASVALVAALAGCGGFQIGPSAGPSVPRPYPAGCPDFSLSPRRCAAIVAALEQQASLAPADVAEIALLGDTECQSDTGAQLCFRTTSFVVQVRFRTTTGAIVSQSQYCGVGGQYTILCSDNPEIAIGVPTGGYRDVPCTGDTPDTCATPYPDPDPASAAAEVPIDIDALSIPIDRLGPYDIELGTGGLANGILEDSSLSVADLHPTSFLLSESGIQLQVTSLAADGKPFDNYYAHGRRSGVEPFSARLRFEVLWFEPGATLELSNIRVN